MAEAMNPNENVPPAMMRKLSVPPDYFNMKPDQKREVVRNLLRLMSPNPDIQKQGADILNGDRREEM